MIVLKTIPEVPAVAAIVDSVFRVSSVSINFIDSTVSFVVTSSYLPLNHPTQSTPIARTVSFAELGSIVSGSDAIGFIEVVRNALALAMNVSVDKVPQDIFA